MLNCWRCENKPNVLQPPVRIESPLWILSADRVLRVAAKLKLQQKDDQLKLRIIIYGFGARPRPGESAQSRNVCSSVSLARWCEGRIVSTTPRGDSSKGGYSALRVQLMPQLSKIQ